ncbi:MAG: AsnC family protein, partial [Pseudomonadota bacterium]
MNRPEILAGDDKDRRIVNALQGDFPICDRPFRAAAEKIGMDEDELIARIETMCVDGR